MSKKKTLKEQVIGVLQEASDLITSEDVDDQARAQEYIGECIEAVQYGEWRICQHCGEERTTDDLEAGELACPKCGNITDCPF